MKRIDVDKVPELVEDEDDIVFPSFKVWVNGASDKHISGADEPKLIQLLEQMK